MALIALAGASFGTAATAAPIALVCEGHGRVTTLVRIDVGVFDEQHRQGPIRFELTLDPEAGTITVDGERAHRPVINETEISFNQSRFGGGYRIDRAAGAWRSKDGAGVCRTKDLTVATGF